MAIQAFGVPVFNEAGNSKNPPVIIGEINNKLKAMGIPEENVINIQAEQEFYHVFYRTVA
jgi:hypothetical protein